MLPEGWPSPICVSRSLAGTADPSAPRGKVTRASLVSPRASEANTGLL